GSRVILRIKTGSGVILRLFFAWSAARTARPVPSSGPREGADMSMITANNPRGGDCQVSRDLLPARQRGVVARSSVFYHTGKWAIDFGLSLFLFIATGPLMLLAMLAIKLTSRGPAVYSQTRLGKDGKPFIIYKLRTMT